MRVILVGLMMSLFAVTVAAAGGGGASDYDVTGVPIYQGPEYSSIDSMPGFGTTVSVAFPAVSPTASVIESNRLPKKSGAVLLIDDDTLVQEFVTSVLAQHGMTAVTASSVERGVELLRERQRDIALVLVDIDMRGVSGAMVVRRLREITSEVAIVIISGYAEREALIMTGVERVMGFLPKPYTHGMLLGEVRKFISP